MSFTVARLTPAISAKSACDIFSCVRLFFNVLLNFIVVYYIGLLGCKDTIFFLKWDKKYDKIYFLYKSTRIEEMRVLCVMGV